MDIKGLIFDFILEQMSNPFTQQKQLKIGLALIVKFLSYCWSFFKSINIVIPRPLLNMTLDKFKKEMRKHPFYVAPIQKKITENDVNVGSFYIYSIHDTIVSLFQSDDMALSKLTQDKYAMLNNAGKIKSIYVKAFW